MNESMQKAYDWLLQNGYTQFADKSWSCEGYEADVQQVLAEYIESIGQSTGT